MVVVSVLGTALAIAGGLVVVYAARLRQHPGHALTRIAALGYAVPGTVLATGLLPVVTGADAVLDILTTSVAGIFAGLLILGSGAALMYAYLVRFLAIATGALETLMGRLRRC